MNYYTSDLHFGHKNIIKLDNRPFKNLEDMHHLLISNWNSTITSSDTVYILGDFIWGKAKQWLEIVPQLNGQKVLIRGNHDLKNMTPEVRKLFVEVHDYLEIQDKDYKVIMSHYPILMYNGSHRDNVIMLCGHVHQTKENEYLEQWKKEISASDVCGNKGNIYNVGCMMSWMGFQPRTLLEIINKGGR